MSEKYKERAGVISQERIGTDIYSLWLASEKIAAAAVPGQFVDLYSQDKSRLLPRPISLCQADKEKGRLRLVYRVVGKGTEEFSHLRSGDQVDLVGPLGNGYPLDRLQPGKKAFLIGGGLGVPPMVELASRLPGPKENKQIVVGYRTSETFLTKELSRYGTLHLATDDGSLGTKGTVLDAVKAEDLHADVIFACGPMPMLRALKKYAQETGTQCWISLEERMACGIGACLGCVCRTTKKDAHSKVNNARVCTEGPVFNSEDVDI